MNEKTQEVLGWLQTTILEVWQGDRFKEWLLFMAKFHSYSARNALLIMTQRPDATMVAGYRKWQGMGRQVKKGEKGISILAPIRRKRETEDGEEDVVGGFRVAKVFDIAQTDGEDVPALAEPVEGDADALLERLVDLVAAEGLTLHTDTEKGYYSRSRQEIGIPAGSTLERAKILAHELAHHHTPPGCVRAPEEVIAEASAFVVMTAHGYDVELPAAEYVAVWATRMDLDGLTECAVAIQQIADTLLQKVRPGVAVAAG